MSIPAEYVSTTQFIVAGEYDNEYPVGRRIEVNLGIDGVDYSHVTAASYSAGNDETITGVIIFLRYIAPRRIIA